MHFVVSWDIKAEGQEWDSINKEMKNCLSGYSWVRPLTTFYIVKVSSQSDWDSIQKNLVSIAKTAKKVNFIMSPLMMGGRYDGWLPQDLWDSIRERTK